MNTLKLKIDIALNMAFAVVKVLALMWVVRLAGLYFPAAALGMFLLARRLASTGTAVLQLGMPYTLIRFVSEHTDHPPTKRAYVSIAVAVWLLVAALTLPILFFLRTSLATWLYPDQAGASGLALWTGILAVVFVLEMIIHHSLMAERRVVLANLLDIMCVSGFLLLGFLLTRRVLTPQETLEIQSCGTAVLSLLFLSAYLWRLRRSAGPPRRSLRAMISDFLGFGLPRGPLSVFEMIVPLVGPWLLRSDPEQAGYLIVALTLVRVMEFAIQPVVMLAYTVTAKLMGRGDEASIRKGSRLMFGITVYLAVLCLSAASPWVHQLLTLWLSDPRLVDGILPYVQVLLWGVVPYTISQSLKGLIEMLWHRPLNLYTMMAGLAAMAVAQTILQGPLGASNAIKYAMLIQFVVMGGGAVLWMLPHIAPLSGYGWSRLALISLVLISANAWLAQQVVSPLLSVALLTATLVAAGAFLFFFPTPFARSCLEFLLPGRFQPR